MNYGWLDPLGRVCRLPYWCSSDGVDMVLHCARLIFKESSTRWRIVGREYKILLVEFFNSLERIAWRPSSTVLLETQVSAEDRGPVDRLCTTCAREVEVNHSVNLPEEAATVEEVGRPPG